MPPYGIQLNSNEVACLNVAINDSFELVGDHPEFGISTEDLDHLQRAILEDGHLEGHNTTLTSTAFLVLGLATCHGRDEFTRETIRDEAKALLERLRAASGGSWQNHLPSTARDVAFWTDRIRSGTGHSRPSVSFYQPVIAQFTEGSDPKAVGDAWSALADLYRRQGLYPQALSALRHAGEAYTRGGYIIRMLEVSRRALVLYTLIPEGDQTSLLAGELRAVPLIGWAVQEMGAQLDEAVVSTVARILEEDFLDHQERRRVRSEQTGMDGDGAHSINLQNTPSPRVLHLGPDESITCLTILFGTKTDVFPIFSQIQTYWVNCNGLNWTVSLRDRSTLHLKLVIPQFEGAEMEIDKDLLERVTLQIALLLQNANLQMHRSRRLIEMRQLHFDIGPLTARCHKTQVDKHMCFANIESLNDAFVDLVRRQSLASHLGIPLSDLVLETVDHPQDSQPFYRLMITRVADQSAIIPRLTDDFPQIRELVIHVPDRDDEVWARLDSHSTIRLRQVDEKGRYQKRVEWIRQDDKRLLRGRLLQEIFGPKATVTMDTSSSTTEYHVVRGKIYWSGIIAGSLMHFAVTGVDVRRGGYGTVAAAEWAEGIMSTLKNIQTYSTHLLLKDLVKVTILIPNGILVTLTRSSPELSFDRSSSEILGGTDSIRIRNNLDAFFLAHILKWALRSGEESRILDPQETGVFVHAIDGKKVTLRMWLEPREEKRPHELVILESIADLQATPIVDREYVVSRMIPVLKIHLPWVTNIRLVSTIQDSLHAAALAVDSPSAVVIPVYEEPVTPRDKLEDRTTDAEEAAKMSALADLWEGRADEAVMEENESEAAQAYLKAGYYNQRAGRQDKAIRNYVAAAGHATIVQNPELVGDSFIGAAEVSLTQMNYTKAMDYYLHAGDAYVEGRAYERAHQCYAAARQLVEHAESLVATGIVKRLSIVEHLWAGDFREAIRGLGSEVEGFIERGSFTDAGKSGLEEANAALLAKDFDHALKALIRAANCFLRAFQFTQAANALIRMVEIYESKVSTRLRPGVLPGAIRTNPAALFALGHLADADKLGTTDSLGSALGDYVKRGGKIRYGGEPQAGVLAADVGTDAAVVTQPGSSAHHQMALQVKKAGDALTATRMFDEAARSLEDEIWRHRQSEDHLNEGICLLQRSEAMLEILRLFALPPERSRFIYEAIASTISQAADAFHRAGRVKKVADCKSREGSIWARAGIHPLAGERLFEAGEIYKKLNRRRDAYAAFKGAFRSFMLSTQSVPAQRSSELMINSIERAAESARAAATQTQNNERMGSLFSLSGECLVRAASLVEASERKKRLLLDAGHNYYSAIEPYAAASIFDRAEKAVLSAYDSYDQAVKIENPGGRIPLPYLENLAAVVWRHQRLAESLHDKAEHGDDRALRIYGEALRMGRRLDEFRAGPGKKGGGRGGEGAGGASGGGTGGDDRPGDPLSWKGAGSQRQGLRHSRSGRASVTTTSHTADLPTQGYDRAPAHPQVHPYRLSSIIDRLPPTVVDALNLHGAEIVRSSNLSYLMGRLKMALESHGIDAFDLVQGQGLEPEDVQTLAVALEASREAGLDDRWLKMIFNKRRGQAGRIANCRSRRARMGFLARRAIQRSVRRTLTRA